MITSPLSRRLHNAVSLIDRGVVTIKENHVALHDEGNETPHVCETFWRELSQLKNRKDVLCELLWLSITTDHPQVIMNDAGILV